MKYALVLFVSLLSPSIWANELSSAQWSYWYKLLHYRSNLFGQLRSEVDSAEFFITKNGDTSPQQELEGTIRAFNSAEAQSFVCRFPLRYKWLKHQIPNDWNYTTQKCTTYNAFVQKLEAKSFSLVFSSFFVRNPGSTFGHTFLRMGRYSDFKQNELLDYAVNFAAQDSQDPMLLYIFKGMTGGYPGRFSVLPYYYKIREYSDHEFRDLWNYDLGLNQSQIDAVVDHIWELGESRLDYYYFTENCSYQILSLLNVAYDDKDILKDLNPVFVLPIDTVKHLQTLGLIKQNKYRMSSYGRLIKESKDLNSSDLHLVKELASNPSSPEIKLTNQALDYQAKILDASISAFDYLKADLVLRNDPSILDERHKLLVLRAENPHVSVFPEENKRSEQAPEKGHHSSRLGISYGNLSGQGDFQGLEWRAAQHELLDPYRGHLKTSQVVILDSRFRFQTVNENHRHIVLDRFRLFDLKKYQPSDDWQNAISFDLGIGLNQKRDCLSQDCISPAMSFGIGQSFEVIPNIILSFLLGGQYQYNSAYLNHSQLALGPKFNLLVLQDDFSIGFDMAYVLPTQNLQQWQDHLVWYNLEGRYFIHRQMSLFMKLSHLDQDLGGQHETQLGLYFYH